MSVLKKRIATAEASVDSYYLFICMSTLMRSFEAGIVASMMPSIKADMGLSYTNVGSIAASPDVGIVTSGLIAATLFKYFGVYKVLTPSYFAIGLTALLCGFCPSLYTLCAARAIGGLFWGFAAIHYPVWINARCTSDSKTVRLAIFQLTLLGGILVGYAVGIIAEVESLCPWTFLYEAEGFMMVFCGCYALAIPSELARASAEETPAPPLSLKRGCLPPEVKKICGNSLFLYSMGQIVAGCSLSTFVLYFIANLEQTLQIGSQDRVVGTLFAFLAGPLGGTLGGAKLVAKRGGYHNFRSTTEFGLLCAVLGFLGTVGVVFSISMSYFSKWAFFATMIMSFMCGIAPMAPLNGIVVAVVPEAAHYASSIQFTLANFGKLVVPQMGGIVVDRLGPVHGFDCTILAITMVSLIAAFGAYRATHGSSGKDSNGIGQPLLVT